MAEWARLLTTSGLIVAIFLVSAWVASRSLVREVRRSVARREALPRLATWWEGVVARAVWVGGTAGALVAAGGALVWMGDDTGEWVFFAGIATGAYLAQAAWMVRAVRAAAK